MQEVNYIHHLNTVFRQFSKDSRLNPSHISLYMALFQFWNLQHFKKKFFINRDEIMAMAKLGSRNTYHRCIKNLDSWGYLHYIPTRNPYKSSKVVMLKFDTSVAPVSYKQGTSGEQALESITKPKQITTNLFKRGTPPSEKEILDLFGTKKWPSVEARKFYFHYQSTGWKLRNNQMITDWQALAEKWMLRENDTKTENRQPQNWDNLNTQNDKDYAEPL